MSGGAHAPSIEGRTANRCSRASAVGSVPPAAIQTSSAPKSTIAIPETVVSARWWVTKSRPSAEADAPRITKMTVKPAMKVRIPRSSFVRTTRSERASGAAAVVRRRSMTPASRRTAPGRPAEGPDADGAVAPTDAPTGTATGAGPQNSPARAR